MLRVDDPLLSLILRFVISGDELKETDDAFIQRQIETLQAHVAQFPEADKEEKALEWIERMQPRRAVLTNMHFDLDYATLEAETPDHITPAYDGLVIRCPL